MRIIMNFGSKDILFKVNADETIVIAEIGVNHNGSLELAKQMVDSAKEAKADVVKFQAFRSEKEISKYAPKTLYQKETTGDQGNQLEMCKALELSSGALSELKNYCDKTGMPFLCAAFDYESLEFLVEDLKMRTVKIASSEVTDIPFLKYVASKRTGVILSTGASSLIECGIAVETLLKNGCPELIILHCISSYPAPFEQVNLRAINTLKRTFRLPVGFSDHTIGVYASVAAVAMGAVALEKHFTLDKNMEGPDHRSSIDPDELSELIKGIRIANLVKGSGDKVPSPCERENVNLIRKSIVASRSLMKGTSLTRDMLEIKRPFKGIEPSDINKIIGLKLTKDVEEDAPITWEDFK